MSTDQSFRSGILEHFPHNSVGAEIGVWKGEWASFINDAINPKKYYHLDPWKFVTDPLHPDRWYGGAIAKYQKDMDDIYKDVCSMFKDSENIEVIRTRGEYAEQYINQDELDWVYIDGDHSYEAVTKDLEISFRLVKSGGLITGDDANPDLVLTVKGWMNTSVYAALTDWIEKRQTQISVITLGEGRQFVFRKV